MKITSLVASSLLFAGVSFIFLNCSNVENNKKDYLQKVLKNLYKIKFVTYYTTSESWVPGDTSASGVYDPTILGEGILKHIVGRLRPSNEILNSSGLISKPLSYSFPSGHTASAFAAAGILAKYFKKYSALIFTLAVLIAFSRLYLYVHYPTDVLAGLFLGLICCKGTIYIFERAKVICF